MFKNILKEKGEKEVFIIAEIGKNFIQTKEDRPISEYLVNAKKLIDAAINAGVDAVKFQTHVLEDEQINTPVTSPHFKGSDRYNWIKRNTDATPLEFWKEIKKYCDEKNIIFFSTPMSKMAAQKLNQVGVSMWKIGSGDVDDYLMIDYISSDGKPIIISSGMVSLKELDDIIKFSSKNNSPLGLLYCVSQYPCPKELFNLGTIEYFIEKYPDVVVGFSDHSITNEVCLAAVKMGAKIIEKHFSLDRNFWGSDHKASILPEEMKSLVLDIRNKNYKNIDTSLYYGNKFKELEGAKNIFRPYFKKALVASHDLKIGDIIKPEDVYSMRPRMYIKGLPSFEYPNIIGKRVSCDLKKYEPINWDVLE